MTLPISRSLNIEQQYKFVNHKSVCKWNCVIIYVLWNIYKTCNKQIYKMLKTFIFLLTFTTALGQHSNCSYVFDGENYSRTAILTIKGLPTNLVHNPINNDLLFTLIDLESLQNDDVQTQMDQYILRNGKPIKIDNVKGQASAVDIKNKRVYIATDGGLNVLNATDKANFLSMKDEDIVQLFKPIHKDQLYVVLYPENEVYVIDLNENGKKKVDLIPCAFFLAIDDNDNIFYECDSKYVKVLVKGFQEPIEFVGIGKNSGRAITVDKDLRVILAANNGIYHLRPDNVIPMKLMDLEYAPSGIAFGDEEFYISANDVIYRYSKRLCKYSVNSV